MTNKILKLQAINFQEVKDQTIEQFETDIINHLKDLSANKRYNMKNDKSVTESLKPITLEILYKEFKDTSKHLEISVDAVEYSSPIKEELFTEQYLQDDMHNKRDWIHAHRDCIEVWRRNIPTIKSYMVKIVNKVYSFYTVDQ